MDPCQFVLHRARSFCPDDMDAPSRLIGPWFDVHKLRRMGEAAKNEDESKTPLLILIALTNYYVAGYCSSGIGSTTVRKG